jgi:hypothetical protein
LDIGGDMRERPICYDPDADHVQAMIVSIDQYKWRATLDIQTHRDRGGVRTARRQALEQRVFRGLLVGVKG